MPEFRELQKNQGKQEKVAKEFKEQGRHGETYTAQRQPPYKQHDFISRIKRKPGGEPR